MGCRMHFIHFICVRYVVLTCVLSLLIKQSYLPHLQSLCLVLQICDSSTSIVIMMTMAATSLAARRARCKYILRFKLYPQTYQYPSFSTDEPLTYLPPKCSWEDEGDDLPELPPWKPLSPVPMEVDSPVDLPPMPASPPIPAFGIWRSGPSSSNISKYTRGRMKEGCV